MSEGNDPDSEKTKTGTGAPDSVAGKSIELPEAPGELPEFARPPSQRPTPRQNTFNPKVVIPMDLLDPHVPSRAMEERIEAVRVARRRAIFGTLGGLAGGALLGAIGFVAYQYFQQPAPKTFDDGVTFMVDSEPPGAAISVDGRGLGEVTPTRLKNWDFSLPHHLRLDLKGYYPDDRTVASGPNPPNLAVKLPRIAHLVATSTPSGAVVTLNINGFQKEAGSTPVTVDVPASRDVQVEMKLVGYLPVTRHFVLEENGNALFDGQLHSMGILAVRSEPAGARCTLDDQPEVTTPADFRVEAGVVHRLKLTVPGLPAQERKITLKEGRREEEVFRFEDPSDRRLRARIEALNREVKSDQRKLNSVTHKGSSSDMFATFGRLKTEDKLTDAMDRADGDEQKLSDELSQHQVELEDRIKAENLKDEVPAGTVIPLPAAGAPEE